MNVLIPMAGAGSRFADAGYSLPKPLIDVRGRPMIQCVVESLDLAEHRHIFVVQKEHVYSYPSLYYLLKALVPSVEIIIIESMTDGAAQTCLLANKFIDNSDPLLIANADQIVDWDSDDFLYSVRPESGVDGCIVTFESDLPHYSYAEVDEKGYVLRTAEKEVISNLATAGLYHWSKGSSFVCAANSMIQKNIRSKNEFYVCPVYNENISLGEKIITYSGGTYHLVGTPEELTSYLGGC